MNKLTRAILAAGAGSLVASLAVPGEAVTRPAEPAACVVAAAPSSSPVGVVAAAVVARC